MEIWLVVRSFYLDGFDQVGRAVGYFLGRLDKMSLSSWVGCLGRCQTTGVAESRGVLSNNGGCRENLGHTRCVRFTNLLVGWKQLNIL